MNIRITSYETAAVFHEEFLTLIENPSSWVVKFLIAFATDPLQMSPHGLVSVSWCTTDFDRLLGIETETDGCCPILLDRQRQFIDLESSVSSMLSLKLLPK